MSVSRLGGKVSLGMGANAGDRVRLGVGDGGMGVAVGGAGVVMKGVLVA